MKLPTASKVVMILAVLLLNGIPAAGTMYVTDVLRLTIRSEPGTRGEILGVIKSGQALEVVTEVDRWTQITLPDGKEGWVPSRFLIPEPTAELKLARLQQQFDSQKANLDAIRSEAAELKKENKRLKSDLALQNRQAEEATNAYNTLKEESADFIKLRAEHKSTLEKATQQSGQIIGLEKELTRLETQRLVRWFIAGAGVLLVGFIIGFSAKRQRRKYLA